MKTIIGFAKVKNIEEANLGSAIKIKRSGSITENELVGYIGPVGTVSAIWIEAPTLFSRPFSLADLNERIGFNPPQSFSKVSKEFEDLLLEALE